VLAHCPLNTKTSHGRTVKSPKVAVQSVSPQRFISFTTIWVTEAQEGFLYLFPSLTYTSLWIILLDFWVILQASAGLWYLKSNSSN